MKEFPKTIKYGRIFRIKLKNNIKNRFLTLKNYKIGLKALECGWVDSVQLNSILRMLKIFLDKKVKIKMNCSLVIPITKKPLEMRMGSGKAERKFWKCSVNKGMILLELDNIYDDYGKKILKIISHRLSFKTSIIKIIY